MTTEVAVADRVRVHFHPPGPMKSFFEGMVRRVDVTTTNGCYFVVEVNHEIILDREHRVMPSFKTMFATRTETTFWAGLRYSLP